MNAKKTPKPHAPLPPELGARIAQALAPIAPAPARFAAMRGKVLERVRNAERFVTVRKRDGEWVALAPDIAMKALHDDAAMRSFLLRLAPGACLPAHEHPQAELCVVLEGDCTLGELELGAGDFHRAAAGTRHGDVRSRAGCVLFIGLAAAATARA
jgi:anti-sigma factor ChrR (cupin superfamily)